MIARVGTALVTAALLLSPHARAQGDMNTMQRNVAANQLGVLEYCRSKGDIDGSAVAGQKTLIARMPAGGSTDAAEATGREGSIMAPNGSKYTLDEMATKGNTTVPALCKQMASSVNQSTTGNPAMTMTPGAMPGGMTMPKGMTMPAMPNGMTTPPMPNGMTMPAMPGMPAMPKTPSP